MIWLIVLAFSVLIFYYNWTRRHLLLAARKFKGPLAWPLVGNGFQLLGKNEDILQKIYLLALPYKESCRIWLGPTLLLVFRQPQLVQKILLSANFSDKHEIYKFMKEILGEGPISSSGPIHKSERKMLLPFFDMSLITNALPIIQKHVNTCMEKLENMVGKGTFNIEPYVHKCFTDAIEEVMFGNASNSQHREFNTFEIALAESYEAAFERFVKFWLHSDIIYGATPLPKEIQEIRNILRKKCHEVICASWNRRKNTFNKGDTLFVPIIDKLFDFIEENPGYCDYKLMEDILLTLYAASEDTLTIISSFTAVCLGMYPEYQAKATEEIRHIFGTKYRTVTLDDIKQAQYLEMCIKDVLRLFPIGPIILRQTREETVLDQYTIPRKAAILIPIFNLHMDERLWQNPHHFHPDHFLPEITKERHPFAYLPFSTGSRGCIGKSLAHHALKLFLCNFLQKFEVEADGKVPDLGLKMDISVRPKQGYNLRLKKRAW